MHPLAQTNYDEHRLGISPLQQIQQNELTRLFT